MIKFDKSVLESNTGKILVKVGAKWCGPCNSMIPVLEEASEEGYRIYDLDIDDDLTVATEFGIRSVPTFLLFEDGELIKKKTGLMSKNQIVDLLK
jgi:thioredoxin 1